ncbi:MAG: HD domain-containing protein, partial [Gemmatimonadaceae bacterium]|nr:HD domain-containing protein [Gemmatimonadaceae bacterium]
MAVLDLSTLAVGDRVSHELLVRERAEAKTKAGDPFWVLTLGNATGTIATAPVWNDQRATIDGAEPGAFVQAIGEVADYKGKRQLVLKSLRLLPPGAHDITQFLPATSDARRESAWTWLDKQRHELKSGALRRAVDLFFADESFRLAFERAPGSPRGHHASIGGLLVHTVEVATIARTTAQVMRANAELALVGALLHDVGKVEAYRIDATGFGFTPAGQLVGHVVLGSWMFDRRLGAAGGAGLSEAQALELQHFILSHHGTLEFGAAVPPMTAEAEIVHWADEASAKANDMLESLADDEHFSGV